MRYISTRGQARPVGFLDAVLEGLAPDGGLYVPEDWPSALAHDEFRRLAATGHHASLAQRTLKAFAGDDLELSDAGELANAAYAATNWPSLVAPLVQLGAGDWVQELFHGPSLSFKDIAMQLMGPLFDYALKKKDRRLSVACATSGDTGGAAVEALKNAERIDLFVLMPKGRISEVQRRFMTASGAPNVHAIEIDGDFDDCQAIIKAMFADRDFAARAHLSGVNSINWARIVAQSVYFHIAANTLSAPGPVNFAVPTGNFGDAYSGFVAKQTGAPIGRVLLATNANDILTRMLASGRYQRAPRAHATLSPAMDIQVASNFERILFEALGRDGELVRRLYDQFAQSGEFSAPPPAMNMLRAEFAAAAVSDDETLAAIASHWNGGAGYMACPHTAVALHARRQAPLLHAPLVTLATAHPAKFPQTLARAIGAPPPLPERCADLFTRPERAISLANDAQVVKTFITQRSRAWE